MDNFLHQESLPGELDSQGEFTLRLDHAQRKIAEYSLQHSEDWLVKVLQAFLAASPLREIRIRQTRNVTEILSELSNPLTPSEFIQFFHSGEEPKEESFKHLKVGLSQACLAQKRPFSLQSGPSKRLCWDGEEFRLEAQVEGRTNPISSLRIEHLSKDSKVNPLGREVKCRKRNLESASRLRELLLAPSRPVKLDGLKVSSGLASYLKNKQRGLIHALGPEALLTSLEPELSQSCLAPPISQTFSPDEPILAILLALHSRTSDDLRRNPKTATPPIRCASDCIWIADGMVVGYDEFSVPKSMAAITLLADARGLPTDASTLQLVESRAKEERFQVLAKKAGPYIDQLTSSRLQLDFKEGFSNSGPPMVGLGVGASAGLAVSMVSLIINPALIAVYTKLVLATTAKGAAAGYLAPHFFPRKEPAQTTETQVLQKSLDDCRRAWKLD